MVERENVPEGAEIMTRQVTCVTEDMSLEAIVEILDKHKVSNAPVVDSVTAKPPTLLGIVSEKDCLEALADELFYGMLSKPQTAATIMTRHPVCIQPHTDLFSVASILVNHGYRHLPVVEGDKLLGIVSRCDVLYTLQKFSRDLARQDADARDPIPFLKGSGLQFLLTHD